MSALDALLDILPDRTPVEVRRTRGATDPATLRPVPAFITISIGLLTWAGPDLEQVARDAYYHHRGQR